MALELKSNENYYHLTIQFLSYLSVSNLKSASQTEVEHYYVATQQCDLFDYAKAQTSGTSQHFRLPVLKQRGSGYVESLQLANGLIIGRMDYQLHQPFVAPYQDDVTLLGFRLLLEGRLDYQLKDREITGRLNAGELLIRQGKLGLTEFQSPAQSRLRGLSVDVPDSLIEQWKSYPADSLHHEVTKRISQPGFYLGKLNDGSLRLSEIGEQFLQLDLAQLCQRLKFEALVMDFLAQLLQPTLTATQNNVKSEINIHYQQNIYEAAKILQQEFVSPPTIPALARRVGINEFYLKSGFRKTYGSTIGTYVRKLKMEKARHLLHCQQCSVKEAALSVGYANCGHFSAAFKQLFGHLPSSARTQTIPQSYLKK